MADVVVSEFMDETVAREILGGTDLLFEPTLVDDRARLLESLTTARAIIVRNRTRVDRELLDHAPKLQAVGRLGVGLDNIDLDACAGRGVDVYPATGANDLAVAEYAITAMLMLFRRAWKSTALTAHGEWPRTELIGRETAGKRLGLIGFGAIARRVGQFAKALDMKVSAFDPYLDAADPAWQGVANPGLNEIAKSCDVISVHVPLTRETHHLVDETFIADMRNDAILINTARGGVVDESALVDALRSDGLGGAALDVFESEPIDEESGRRFRDVPNLILTPHIAGITEESNLRVSRVTAENVARHLQL